MCLSFSMRTHIGVCGHVYIYISSVGWEGAQASGRQGRLVFFLWQREAVHFLFFRGGGAGGWEAGQISFFFCGRGRQYIFFFWVGGGAGGWEAGQVSLL
jgi:hypothetical protein